MPRKILEIDPTEPYTVEPNAVEPSRTQPERPLPRLVEPPPIAAEPVRFTRLRSILILESDPSIRKLLRRLLHRRGYFTHEVLQPEDLPAELRERRVDLLITDTPLMDASGSDGALALTRVYPNLKILALLSESPNGVEIAGRSLALTKPFSLETFLECVDRLIEVGQTPSSVPEPWPG
jgi:DNA-binding NtrC family response regulator